ncbi:hypothetical protein [Nitrosospira sp. Nsp1]|uniref:hypothetical protein n=1 Tax=Nitrosospira sp. Nsp1 TaxID=136547 RepID=UPI00089032BF|nr:hypothetical protein [Nitrosospira sp. Nsp1]SCX39026.1 hypothetical protein SAMN05720354_102122 [Nitrosospira sp. Nsp1]
MSKILHEPFSYPFDIARSCFSVTESNIGYAPKLHISNSELMFSTIATRLSSTVPAGAPAIKTPVGLLTCGSNASPTRLKEKLATVAVPLAFAIRLQLREWIPVYAATLSYYGAIPATFERIPEASGEPFLIVTDIKNLNDLMLSEQLTGNYDAYEVTRGTTDINTDFPVLAFIAKYGALRLGEKLLPLKEFQPASASDDLPTQREVIKLVLSSMNIPLTLKEYHERINNASFVLDLRERIIAAFGTTPNVPGWLKVSL